jgi:hypothetical protein
MQTYDLTQLVPWTRRAAGDEVSRQFETIVSDGTRRFNLNNDGYIKVVEIDEDGTPVASGDFANTGSVVTLSNLPLDGAQLQVSYDRAQFSDQDIADSLLDGSLSVLADTKGRWNVDLQDYLITDDGTQAFWTAQVGADFNPNASVPPRPNPSLVYLIVLRAALAVYERQANPAAVNSVSVKDGTTTINTAVASKNIELAMKRMQARYDAALKKYRSDGFVGQVLTDDVGPYREFPLTDRYGRAIYNEKGVPRW